MYLLPFLKKSKNSKKRTTVYIYVSTAFPYGYKKE